MGENAFKQGVVEPAEGTDGERISGGVEEEFGQGEKNPQMFPYE